MGKWPLGLTRAVEPVQRDQVWEINPEDLEAGDLAPPLAHSPKPVNSWGNAGELTLIVRTRESWQADQFCNYPGPKQCYRLAHLNIHPICDL